MNDKDQARQLNHELTMAEVDVLDLKDQLRAARAENRQLAYDKREIAALFEADHDGWKRRAKAAEARCTEMDQARAYWEEAHRKRFGEWKAAEENLSFAQQRAADNGLRAQIGEEKITALVAEVRDLKSRIAAAAALCVEAAPYGYIHDALTGPIDNR